tara:strand:+ start:381 stop:491 length:111 start_codon:yes stop_codon:yes gene_type:complete
MIDDSDVIEYDEIISELAVNTPLRETRHHQYRNIAN